MHACVRSLEHEPASPLAAGFTNTASYVTEHHEDATTTSVILSQLFTFLVSVPVPVPVSVPVPAFPCFPVALQKRGWAYFRGWAYLQDYSTNML